MISAEEIAKALGGKPSGSGWMACCPAHDDRKASLQRLRTAANRSCTATRDARKKP